MGPLQLAIHVAGEQNSHEGKTNNGNYHLKLCTPFQHGGFVPRERLAAKGLFI